MSVPHLDTSMTADVILKKLLGAPKDGTYIRLCGSKAWSKMDRRRLYWRLHDRVRRLAIPLKLHMTRSNLINFWWETKQRPRDEQDAIIFDMEKELYESMMATGVNFKIRKSYGLGRKNNRGKLEVAQ